MTFNEACKKLYPKACAILVKLGIQWGLDGSAEKLHIGLTENDEAFLDAVEVYLEFTRLVDGSVEVHGKTIYGDLVRCDDTKSLRAGMDLFRWRLRRSIAFVLRNIRDGSHLAFLRTDDHSRSYWIVFNNRDEQVTREILASAYRTLINIREGGA